MAMTNVTKLSDLIAPEVFADYVQDASTQTNRFVQSGILTPDPNLGNKLLQPGWGITIPVLNDLTGDPQEWNDTTDIKSESLDSRQETDVKFSDVKSFAATDFGQLISGAPVINQITTRFGNWWARVDEQRLIALVKDTFANDDIKTAKSYNVGAEKQLSAADFVAALARMGDTMDNTLSQVVVNSAAYSEMRRQNLIEYIQPSNGGTPIASYNGMAIVQDDSIPVSATDGTTYALIFGKGAVQYSTVVPANGSVINRDETSNGGEQQLINKRLSTMHVAGTTLDVTQLTNGLAGFRADFMSGSKPLYKIAGDARNIQVVQYGFKVGTDLIVPGVNSPKGASVKSTNSSSSSKK